jgi:uncharacterized protein (DUF1810 family)
MTVGSCSRRKEVRKMYDLERFVSAQDKIYQIALSEMQEGHKVSHWMWYIFPQLKGLGFSSTAKYYGIYGAEEAKAYLEHPLLGTRLREITKTLLNVVSNDAEEVMGYPDDLKLQSCMTLFAQVSNEKIFMDVLNKFFAGKMDEKTLKFLKLK